MLRNYNTEEKVNGTQLEIGAHGIRLKKMKNVVVFYLWLVGGGCNRDAQRPSAALLASSADGVPPH